MAPIIIERGRSLLGILTLGAAMALAARDTPPPEDALGPPPPQRDPHIGDLAAALSSDDNALRTRALYDACRRPAGEALAAAAVVAEAGDRGRATAQLVRDCVLPRAEAIRELEALIEADDPISAVAALELHRLGAGDSPVLAALADRQPGLAGWLAAYSARR